jgi:RNA polymerase subunit RPABC4/transcription elongation factor Spt4
MGQMEFQCLFSAGVGPNERCLTSDGFKMYVCKKCGNIADGNRFAGYFMCRYCRLSTEVRSVDFSWSSMVMIRELQASGIHPTFTLKDK